MRALKPANFSGQRLALLYKSTANGGVLELHPNAFVDVELTYLDPETY